MLNFLRNFRRNNLSSKYFKYAIGEIVLVVIGILIALSISNWNENRKSDKYELLLLQEIDNAIKSDIALINEQFIRRTNRKDSAIQALKNMVISNGPKSDEIIIDLIHKTEEGFAQRYTSGPYEALKSNGLDKIKSDSLRALLVHTYDERLPAQMGFIQHFNELYDDRLAKARAAIIGSKIIEQDGQAVITEYLKIKNILKSSILHELLNYEEKKAEHSLWRLDVIQNLLEEMSDKIQEELKERKGIHHD